MYKVNEESLLDKNYAQLYFNNILNKRVWAERVSVLYNIISDSVSVGIILNELKNINEGNPLQENKIHYKDYTV